MFALRARSRGSDRTGEGLSDDCPTCGGCDLPVGSRFCPFCGSRLGAYTPEHLTREVLDKRDTLRGERKEVTVLFADVVDSLAMAAALDPEDVHALMDGFFALSLEAIHLERGTINQFRGDGFMALFGAPQAQGEDAARALRAALEIRSRAESYSESIRARYGFPLALRMGVNTGHVWVGSIGGQLRKDYTAEGPAVGLAARLQGDATPGQILVGEETVRRCGEYFEFVDQGKFDFCMTAAIPKPGHKIRVMFGLEIEPKMWGIFSDTGSVPHG